MSFPSLGTCKQKLHRCRVDVGELCQHWEAGLQSLPGRLLCCLQQGPSMLVRGREKGKPPNSLHDSIYEADVLSTFQSPVLRCIREKRHFSKEALVFSQK